MGIIHTSLIISLFCMGLWAISQEGYLLYFIRKPFENLTGWRREIMKPIILCPVCMASVWGATTYYYLHGWSWDLIICCLIAAFFNKIFTCIIEKLET